MIKLSSLYAPRSTEFPVDGGDFSTLEIRDGGNGDGFHYFYDTSSRSLVTDFVLEDGKQVATLCHVKLIKKGEEYTPRLRFWKKDKTRRAREVINESVEGTNLVKIVKASVDTSKAHENFWKLINFLQSFVKVSLPTNDFRVVSGSSAHLAETLVGRDKQTIIEAVRIAIGGELTEDDLRLMSNRKAQLDVFGRLLYDEEFFAQEQADSSGRGPEAVWQQFFEANPWIFGYGLTLVACEPLDDTKLERMTTGANVFTGAGKRSDAVMRSKGFVSSLVFCEIKTHRTPLLEEKAYRKPDVYQVSDEVSGGLSQVQKTVTKALAQISEKLHSLYEDDGTPTGIQVSTIRPRQVLVVGNLDEFRAEGQTNPEKSMSFELYRNSIQDVEIITFDELYERACFIVRDT